MASSLFREGNRLRKVKGPAQSPLVVTGRARFEPRARAPDQMLFGQSALADEFLCHPQAWFLDPEVSAGSTHRCQTKCHKSRLSCLPVSWERKVCVLEDSGHP